MSYFDFVVLWPLYFLVFFAILMEHGQSSDTCDNSKKQILGLPAPGDALAPTLEVNGPSTKLDHLGPVVINSDGTLSRITNWQQMTESEREKTYRVIVKRNKARLEALKQIPQ